MRSTYSTPLLIDVSPDGIKFTIEGVDSDLASLISAASTFTVQTPTYRTVDSSDVVIKSDKVIQFIDPPVTP